MCLSACINRRLEEKKRGGGLEIKIECELTEDWKRGRVENRDKDWLEEHKEK